MTRCSGDRGAETTAMSCHVGYEGVPHHGNPRLANRAPGLGVVGPAPGHAQFDTVAALHHSTSVVNDVRRLAATIAILTHCVGNPAVCAGWRATPEARMACCQDETTCPMHKSDAHGSAPQHQLTQAEADTCCAGSEPNESATTRPVVVSSGIVALGPAIVPLVVIPTAPALEGWRALVPLRASPVPKHLLLSVFLV